MTSVIILLLVMQAVHFVCTCKLYTLSGHKAWEAAVPFYSAYILMKIIQRPWWWTILLYIPVVGNVMALVIWTDTSRAFGYRGVWWTLLAVFTLGLSLGWISWFGHPVYDSEYRRHRHALDSSILGAIVFAVTAASLIKAFTYEAYTIPTSSMEGSMLVGDFLFVNKMAYGTRIAMTPLSAPLVHDSIPLAGVLSYLKCVELPYMRLPALRKIKRNDIVVFNWPVDMPDEKPIDKKANYIKRCVAIAGDTLEIKDAVLYVNGKEQKWSERDRPQWEYRLMYKRQSYGSYFYQDLDAMGVEIHRYGYADPATGEEIVDAYLSDYMLGKVRAAFPGVKVEKQIKAPGVPETDSSWPIFPYGANYNVDNYGPLYVPKKGDVIHITPDNLSQYTDIITTYEGNTLTTDGTDIIINGEKTDTYTIKQDYYFMMGDNRHNSLDSRFWGYVPHDHIVGAPALIWMSIKADDGSTPLFKRIRTERIISFPMGEGPMKSYLLQTAVGAVVLYCGYKLWRHRRKNSKKGGEKR